MNQNINKFSDKADNYAKYRQGYSGDILEYFSEYGFSSNSIVADIGSGTGKLAKLFLENGNTVYAVEPNNDMRNMADKSLNGFENFISINGSAENTTLQSDTIDFVVVGQAFHWFDAPKALVEFKRILRKNGVLAIIWYHRKTDAPFWKEYENILKGNIPEYKGSNHRNFTDETMEKYFSGDYKKIEKIYSRELDFVELLGSFSSSSYTPKEDTIEHRKISKLLNSIFIKYLKNNKIISDFGMEIYIGRI